jgi:DtxR family Mn-dependent transcriptional regulator
MLKKLDELGLISHVPYRGVRLTPEGRRVALEVIRHHRLLELYLAEALQMPWDRVHDEAEVLEHVLSDELEALIAAKLGNPTIDPHGDPIPSADLELEESPTRTLESLVPGEGGTFVRVSDADPEMLRYLAQQGVLPGGHLQVIERQPFGGPLLVNVDGREHTLGGALPRAMRISVDPHVLDEGSA